MKRELAFALESQSHLTEFSGRTRSCKSPPTIRINEEIQGCSSTENETPLNTSIDQNRASRVHTCNALHVYRRNNNKRLKIEEGESVIKAGLVIKEVKNERKFTRSALESKVVGNLGLGNGNSGNYVAMGWESYFSYYIRVAVLPKQFSLCHSIAREVVQYVSNDIHCFGNNYYIIKYTCLLTQNSDIINLAIFIGYNRF